MQYMFVKLKYFFKNLSVKTNIHKILIKNHMQEFHNHIKDCPIELTLDIGSGQSPYKSLFTSKEYISLDIDIQKGEVDIIGDLCNLPIKEGIAHLVICTEVLEHVENIEKAMQELHRILKKGGYLVLSTPLLIGVHDSIDYYRFTDIALKSLLDKYKFEILLIRKRGGIFSSLYGILSIIPHQLYSCETPRGEKNYKDKNYIKDFLAFVFYLSLFPIMKLCLVLDKLDKNKNFTLGYEVLAKKRE